MAKVLERALYRHFKATPEVDQLYVTLRVVPEDDGYQYVEYVRAGDLQHILTREATEFTETVARDGRKLPRFSLVMAAVITKEEADSLQAEKDDN